MAAKPKATPTKAAKTEAKAKTPAKAAGTPAKALAQSKRGK